MHDLNDLAWFVQVVDHGGLPLPVGRSTSLNPNSAAALRNWKNAWACA